jgi:uncharacterized membrane protein HdeD (DUF308 family)
MLMGIRKGLLRGDSTPRVLLFFVVGLLLLLFPGLSWDVLCFVIGGLMVLAGAGKVYRHYKEREYPKDYGFGIGLVTVAGGLIIMFMPKVLGGVAHVLIGFALVAAACLQAEMVLRFRQMKANWVPPLVGAVVTLILGVVVLRNPFTEPRMLMRFTGVAMILEALADGGAALLLNRLIKKSGL